MLPEGCCRMRWGIGIFILMVVICGYTSAQGETGMFDGNLRLIGPDSLQILSLKNGSSMFGRITQIGDSTVTFVSDIGETKINIGNIKEIKIIAAKAVKGGNYWFENPNLTRLYFSSTGRMLKARQGYFCDYYLFFPGVAYGITDNVSFGAGMSIFPGLDLSEQLYYVSPKVGISATKNTNLSLGLLFFAPPKIDDERFTFGVLMANGTFGGPDASFTAGIGYGFVKDDFADKPVVTLGGEVRFARRISFVSENWVLPGTDQIPIIYGLRFFGEGLSVDLGLVNMIGEDAIFPGVPWVDFVFNF